MRDTKQRHSQNAGVENATNGNCGTQMQGWKMRKMETVAQYCRVGNAAHSPYGQTQEHLVRL